MTTLTPRLVPTQRIDPTLATCRQRQRFWRQVLLTDTCWLWTGGGTNDGYGNHWYAGQTYLAHRIAHVLLIGPIPTGYEVDHLCFNRACVRPDHLEAVTPDENIRRRSARVTHCNNGHPFAGTNLVARSDGGRRCRECRRNNNRRHMRAWRARRKAHAA